MYADCLRRASSTRRRISQAEFDGAEPSVIVIVHEIPGHESTKFVSEGNDTGSDLYSGEALPAFF